MSNVYVRQWNPKPATLIDIGRPLTRFIPCRTFLLDPPSRKYARADIGVMLQIEQNINDMFTTGLACGRYISKNNCGLCRDMKMLPKIAMFAIHDALTELINSIKTKRYLISHDQPVLVVSGCFHEELKQMHFTKPCTQRIRTIVVKILNILLEIRNLLDNLWNECHCFLRVHECLKSLDPPEHMYSSSSEALTDS